jgi:hypothetical protein
MEPLKARVKRKRGEAIMGLTLVRKTLNMLLMLFALMVLFCFIGFRLGYNGLLIVGEIEMSVPVENVIRTIFFGLQMLMVSSFVLDMYDRKVVIGVLGYMVLHTIVGLTINSGFIIASVTPFCFMFGLAVYNKQLKLSSIRALIIGSVMFLYQIYAIVTKIGYERLGFNTMTTYEWLVCSIDLMLLIFVLYAKGGVKHVARKLLFLPDGGRYVQSYHENRALSAETEEYLKLKGFERLFAMSLLLVIQMAQWAIILFVCHLGNVFVEGIVITTSFIAHGFVIKQRWHSNNLVICTLASTALFYIAARLTLSFTYSQFFPIIVGLAMIYTLYRLSTTLNEREVTLNQATIQRLRGLEMKIDAARKTVDDIDELM